MNRRRPRWEFETIGFNSRRLRKLHSLLWLVAALACGACRTVPPFAAANLSDPGWTVRQGQAVWRPKTEAPEIAGELLVATHRNGETLLQFTKIPLPLVVARTATNRWHIEFVADHRGYSGRGKPPARIGWLHLASCVAGHAPPAPWHCEKRPDNHWRLESRINGELFEGFLTP